MTPKTRSKRPGLALALLLPALGLAALVLSAPARAESRGVQPLPFGEVNWDAGLIRVSAIGLPPFGGYGGDPREAARQSAVSLAQRRLLGVLLDLPTRSGKLRDQLETRPELKERLRGLLGAAAVAGKTFADGSVEITLTLPMEGQRGVAALLREL